MVTLQNLKKFNIHRFSTKKISLHAHS